MNILIFVDLQIYASDLVMFTQLHSNWQRLLAWAYYRERLLEPSKAIFVTTSKQMVFDLEHICRLFAAEFFERGPTSAGRNVDYCMILMEVIILI